VTGTNWYNILISYLRCEMLQTVLRRENAREQSRLNDMPGDARKGCYNGRSMCPVLKEKI